MMLHAYKYLIALLILTLVAFQPTYLGKLSSAHWIHHYHGFTGFLWMALLIAQGFFVSTTKWKLHRTLGLLSLLVAVMFIHGGLLGIHLTLNNSTLAGRQLGIGLSFGDLISILTFAWLYFCGLKNLKNKPVHARYMMATALLLITAVVSRLISYYIPFLALTSVEQFMINLNIGQCVTLLICALLIYRDKLQKQDITPYSIVFAVVTFQIVSSYIVGADSPWAWIAMFIANIPLESYLLLTLPLAVLPCASGYVRR